jgi:hypothetical protein
MRTFHELICISLLISLFFWTVDFLSDSYIIKDETKLGIFQYIHHLAATIAFLGPFINLFTGNFMFYVVSIILSIIIQSGFLINDDYCWLTLIVNKCINKEQPKRKWRADLSSFVKHYTRGDSWAYSDMYKPDFTSGTLIINCVFIVGIIKLFYNKQQI